jgi:sugar phosphate isomerase/epimerase
VAPLGDRVRSVFDRLAAGGYRCVQLSATQPGMRPRELDQSARRDLAATLRRRELAVSGLDLWIPAAHFRDPAECDRALAAAIGAIELAAALDRCPVSVLLPPESDDGASPIIGELTAAADRHGVPIADHALPLSPHEGVGVGIDPAAWLASAADPVAGVSAVGQRLLSARLCDLLSTGLRGPIGDPDDGRLDVLAYHVALSVAGYARPVVVDARQWAHPWDGLARTREAWTEAATFPTS